MKNILLFKLHLVLFSILLPVSDVSAHDYNAGKLEIAHPWARPTAPVVKTGAVYLTIHNPLHHGERLISASVPPFIAQQVQIHQTTYHQGMAKMREANQGIEIPAQGSIEFSPGGRHIMLVGLTKPLLLGTKFPMTLKFEHSPESTVEVWVEDTPVQSTENSEHSHH